jgi:hypothetical protein
MTNMAVTPSRKRAPRGKIRPVYTWCLHCEKVFKTSKWREAAPYDPHFERSGECPECGAGECVDGWEWSRVAKANGYPTIPEEGKYYPLYGSMN